MGRSGNQHCLGAKAGEGAGDGVTLFAGRAVGDVAHRVDRLMGRPGGHQRPKTMEASLVALEMPDHMIANHIHFGEAPNPNLAARQFPFGRFDYHHAVLAQLPDVAHGGRLGPHLDIHGGGRHHRLVGGEQRGGGQVIGDAVGHFGQQVGGRRNHQQQVGLP